MEKSTKKVKSFGAHYKDIEKSVISIVKYLDETLETLDVKKKNQLRKKALRPNGAKNETPTVSIYLILLVTGE